MSCNLCSKLAQRRCFRHFRKVLLQNLGYIWNRNLFWHKYRLYLDKPPSYLDESTKGLECRVSTYFSLVNSLFENHKPFRLTLYFEEYSGCWVAYHLNFIIRNNRNSLKIKSWFQSWTLRYSLYSSKPSFFKLNSREFPLELILS